MDDETVYVVLRSVRETDYKSDMNFQIYQKIDVFGVYKDKKYAEEIVARKNAELYPDVHYFMRDCGFVEEKWADARYR